MPSNRSVTRRRLLGASAAAGAALAGPYLGSSGPGLEAAEAKAAPSVGAEGQNPVPVIDCHAHLTHHSSANYQERDDKLIEAADKLGIDRLCCSILTPKASASATPGWSRRSSGSATACWATAT